MQKLLILFSLIWCVHTGLAQSQWTEFRGPNRGGVTTAAPLPIEFKPESAAWRTEIHNVGWSSPVVWQNQIWLTTAAEDGTAMYAICIDKNTGKIVHDQLVFRPTDPQRIHGLNSYATPTAAVEAGRVYVHFGAFGTACLDTDSGAILWKRDDMPCEHMQGPASSPVLYKNLVILHLEGTERPRIAALDKRTGQTVWEVERPDEIYKDAKPVYRKAYITPIIITVDGRDMLISNGSKVCQALDPQTGAEIWRLVYGGDSTVSCPLFANGLLFINCGLNYVDGKEMVSLWAVKPRGSGDITETNVVWKRQGETNGIPTPVIVGDYLFMVDDRGTVVCLETQTGAELWKREFKGRYMASPIAGNSNVYFFAQNGDVTVIQAAPEFVPVAESRMPEKIQSTPTFDGTSVLLRTESALYQFE